MRGVVFTSASHDYSLTFHTDFTGADPVRSIQFWL